MRTLLLAALCMFSAPLAAESLAGEYGVTGFDPHNGEPYQGTATITGADDVYQITWNIPQNRKVYVGTGIRKDDHISFVFVDPRSPNSPGVQIYTINNDMLSGKWIRLGLNKKGTESLKRLQ